MTNRQLVTVDETWTRIDTCGCCGRGGVRARGEARGLRVLACTGCGTHRFEAVAPPEAIYRDGYHSGELNVGWDWTSPSEITYRLDLGDQAMRLVEAHHALGALVDVGGGLGYLAAAAQRRGWKAELIEPVATACAFARDELGVPATEGGIDGLAELGRQWDVVALLHIIEHLPDVRSQLERVREVVAPNGLIFVEVPNYASVSRWLQGDDWHGWGAGEHVYLFSPATLVRLLDRAGYDVVVARTHSAGSRYFWVDGYAHMVGLQGLLNRANDLKRKVQARAGRMASAPALAPTTGNEGTAAFADLPALVDKPGVKGAVYRRALPAIDWLERSFRVATNIQVLARPRR